MESEKNDLGEEKEDRIAGRVCQVDQQEYALLHKVDGLEFYEGMGDRGSRSCWYR